MTMCGRTLAVLMWKHLMVRKRRYIHTAVEVITPLVFFFILFQSRKYFQSSIPAPTDPHSTYDYKVQLPDTIPLSSINVPRKIYYYPRNALTDELMDEVGKQLLLSRLNVMPKTNSRRYKGYYGVRNLTEILSYLDDMDNNEAYIVFENIDGNEWPAQLIYTIRTKGFFLTNSYEPTDQVSRPHRRYGEVYEEFVRLQWTIDTSFINIFTGTNVTQKASIQEFPYYGNYVRPEAAVLCSMSSFFSFVSLIILFVFQMQRLLEEKATGIQELIRMVGVSTNLLGFSHFLNVLPVGIIYSVASTLFLKTTSQALFPHSDGFIMFLMFILHFISVIAMAFACSYLVRSTQYVTSISVFTYMALYLPARLMTSYSPPRAFVLLAGVFPHKPMDWYWREVQTFEYYGDGLGWTEAQTGHTDKSGPVIMAMAWLVIQSLLFFFLAWYLARVAPGKYGIAQPWNFLCQRRYWSRNEVDPEMTDEDPEVLIERDEKYFEPPPKHLPVGIKIENVSKMFPKHKALSNVNLEVYKGEITVLLGHNGAGKTTLMSIITGILSPSEGKVFVNGEDISRNREEVGKQIGLCPQHNLVFPDLTVLEHVVFFTMLISGHRKTVRESSLALLSRLGLADKAEARASQLSGGMQRRLQLAIALAGDADVLVLDEPTAGLDVETRRELWDLLLSLRGSRAVLLSTHFMEEADALGDRVAALHAGRLRCHATTMHLKKAIGTGYRLHLTTLSSPRDAAITDVVTSKIPAAALLHKSINTLTYNLPAATSSKFPELFTAIEERKTELEIESIGVGASTLEEVFLKLCSDTDFSQLEDQVDGTMQEPIYEKVTGFPLYMRQFRALLKRQFNFFMSKKMSFIALQVLSPITAIFVVTIINNGTNRDNEDIHARLGEDLTMYRSRSAANVMYKIKNTQIVDLLKRDYPNINFIEAGNIEEEILRTGKESTLEYNKYLVGIELNDTNAKVMYTTVVRHAAAVAMNLLTNIISAMLVGGDSTKHIKTYNHPIPTTGNVVKDTAIREPKDTETLILWAIFLVFIILASLSNLASLPCSERVSGSRHIHLMSGCASLVHWAATLFSHTLVAFVTLVLSTAIATLIFDSEHTINNPSFFGCLILVLTLGIMAFLALMYVVSFMFGERGTGVLLIAVIVIFAVITPVLAMSLEVFQDHYPGTKFLIGLCQWLAPPHALFLAMRTAANVARLNAYCRLNVQRCPNLIIMEKGFDAKACCAGLSFRSYYTWDDFSPMPYILSLIFQFFFYMTIVILTQEGVFCRLKERIVGSRYKPSPLTQEDEDVKAEREFVERIDKSRLENSKTAMLVQDLHKNYAGIRKNTNAVKGINFSVKNGECFGLLGVNGAGKSTTFKMITAEECITRGTIYANGYHIHTERKKYMRTLGYCPQFFGLDSFQTGRANLELLTTLRGLNSKDVQSEVKTWLGIVGLEKFGGRAVSSYSGGMCRRLGAAAALCSGHTALLDEPTAGVDVAARRRVWAALRVRLQQRPVLLSSHSMDEMEALCHRVAILAGGRVRAIGSPHELRARHARGHALTLKLRSDPHTPTDEVDSARDSFNNLKTTLLQKFDCTLKDEHKTMLHYHINETMQYSVLFAELEDLKAAFPSLLEDYSVTETTLEEVFLSFAKQQQEEEGTRAKKKKKKDRNNIV